MRWFAGSIIGLLLVSACFAVSDVGLLKTKGSLGYYLMPSTNVSHFSSGLVYNNNLDTSSALEILYTSYRSPYLLTSNVTQVGVHGKRKFLDLGAVALSGILGVGAIYSPAVGGGLTGDVGLLAAVRPLENFAFSIPANMIVFNDGLMMNVNPTLNFKPAFLYGHEAFGGFRLDASVVGNLAQMESGGASGKINTYYFLGLRAAI